MKAMLLKAANTPLVLESVPDPVPGPGEAVAKVLACGAGLTIHHARAGRIKVDYPRILGHEITGEIVAVGAGRDEPQGRRRRHRLFLSHLRRVPLVPHQPRDAVRQLRRLRRPRNRRRLCGIHQASRRARSSSMPEGLDWRNHPAEAGVICDAIATPLKVTRRARITPTDTVAVFGAGGGLGVHMLNVARWAHARKVIAVDVMASKFEACVKAGADATVDASDGRVAEQLLELTGGKGIDVAIDFVCSTSTLEAAFAALGKGGRLVTLGGHGAKFTATPAEMLRKELELLGSRYATKEEVVESLELVARGELWPMVTEKVPLAQAEAIHQRLDKGLITGRAALMIG